MAAYDDVGGEHPAPRPPGYNWWEQPPPDDWPLDQPWPPPLPPGGAYGPRPGQIIPPATPTAPTQPGIDVPTTTPSAPPSGPSPFDYTLPGAPTFTPPGYTPPPAFSYDNFTAPTGESVLNDPGYQFRLKQGEQALLNNRAARGMLNTGGTIKDFLGYNQNFATQEYGNVWDRAADTYRTNRGNALDTYNTNYKTQYTDPYDISYKGALDTFAPQMENWKTNVSDMQHQADERRRYAWMIGSA